MRVRLSLMALLAMLASVAPVPAAAEGGPAWEACVGLTSTPDERVKACSSVIDGAASAGAAAKPSRATRQATARRSIRGSAGT